MPALLAPPRSPRRSPEVDLAATRRQLLAGAGAFFALAACGAPGQVAPPAAVTRTADGDFGPVTLPADPQRVLAGYDTDTDVALVLDLPLVGAPGARGSGDLPFPDYQPADRLGGVQRVATFLPEPNLEAMAALRPDCIIDGAFGVQERYDALTRIAPTMSYNTALYTDWRDGLLLVAQAFGREAKAQEFLDAYAARAAALRPRVEERFPERSAAVFYARDGGGVTIDVPSNQVLASMVDCGFTRAEVVPASNEAGGAEVSLERLGDLAGVGVLVRTVDLRFGGAGPTTERDLEPYAPLAGSELWARVPAVAGGRLVDVPAELGFPSPLTALATLDFVEGTLLA
ncbi:hypothetical protein BJF78_19955 [Pseudonocardia sp. CNS-139]|nr:hypothetical protein BJF78_19955 [Pseudonocardia sp. CNS-139]